MQFFKRGKQSTIKQNAYALRKYCEWLKQYPPQLIEEYNTARKNNNLKEWQREQINRIMQFYNELGKRGKSLNTIRSTCAGVLAFYRQNTEQIPDVTKDFAPPQMAQNQYRFTQDDLRKMYYFGDIEEKCLVALAISYAQGAKEFLELECEMLQRLVQEAKDKGLQFISWRSTARAKTSIQPISFLTPEAIESIEVYLQFLMKKHGKLPKYIWCNSKLDRHITNEGLNKKVKRLLQKANINTYKKRVSFHLFRKFTFSRLRRIDKDIAKIICAKQVSTSDMTYEEIESQADKVFRLAYKDLTINGDASGKQRQKQSVEIKQLTNAVTSLQSEMIALRTREDLAIKDRERVLKESQQHYINNTQSLIILLETISAKDPQLKDILKQQITTLKQQLEEIKNL